MHLKRHDMPSTLRFLYAHLTGGATFLPLKPDAICVNKSGAVSVGRVRKFCFTELFEQFSRMYR